MAGLTSPRKPGHTVARVDFTVLHERGAELRKRGLTGENHGEAELLRHDFEHAPLPQLRRATNETAVHATSLRSNSNDIAVYSPRCAPAQLRRKTRS